MTEKKFLSSFVQYAGCSFAKTIRRRAEIMCPLPFHFLILNRRGEEKWGNSCALRTIVYGTTTISVPKHSIFLSHTAVVLPSLDSFTISFLFFYVKRKQTTTKRKAHARDRELEIISKAWHTRPVVVCACRVSAREYLLCASDYFCSSSLISCRFVFKLNVTMCGTRDDALKTRSHELILFNVTYENIKISYSFMVNFEWHNLKLSWFERAVCHHSYWPYPCPFFYSGQSRQIQLHVDDKQL